MWYADPAGAVETVELRVANLLLRYGQRLDRFSMRWFKKK